MRFIVAGLMLALSAPVAALTVPFTTNGFQSIVDFDNIPVGTGAFTTGSIPTHVSGGSVALGTPANPALSGTQVYGGTTILVTVGPALRDLIDYSWPDIGAFVTASAPVLLRLSYFDYNALEERPAFDVAIDPGTHVYLSGGTVGFFTSAEFSSSEYFTIDRLLLGLPDVGPGIPEPATWALLIVGFGLTGATLRRRRGAAA